MRRTGVTWVRAVLFTLAMLVLVSLAVAGSIGFWLLAMIAAVSAAVSAIYFIFPGSMFFVVALTNFLVVYSCIYIFFLEVIFGSAVPPVAVSRWLILVCFILPIVAFVLGAWWRRAEVRRTVGACERGRGAYRIGVLEWLIPVAAVGASMYVIPDQFQDFHSRSVVLVVAMAVIASIVLAASRDVAAFLVDAGLLFEEFFLRSIGLAVPAFAFLTFYSLIIIVFGSLYRILDTFSDVNHFEIGGVARDIAFSEAMYFSIVTLSTVGYGDIVPLSGIVRVIVSVQMIFGVMLLLFGVSEILQRSRRRPPGE